MSLQSQEPQLQSVVRNGALATGQRLFPTLKLYVAYSEAEQLSGIILCSNRWLCQDSRVNLLEVLEWPTTNVDFWTAFLRGKDGWLQPLKLYATCSGGEAAFRQDEDNVESFSSSGSVMRLPFSTPVQWTPLVYPILFKWKYSQIHWHTKQSFSKCQHLNTAA